MVPWVGAQVQTVTHACTSHRERDTAMRLSLSPVGEPCRGLLIKITTRCCICFCSRGLEGPSAGFVLPNIGRKYCRPWPHKGAGERPGFLGSTSRAPSAPAPVAEILSLCPGLLSCRARMHHRPARGAAGRALWVTDRRGPECLVLSLSQA